LPLLVCRVLNNTRLDEGHTGPTKRKAFDLLTKARIIHKISACNPSGLPLGAPEVGPALAAGKRVFLINGAAGKPNANLGWWSMGSQVGTAFAKHPALGDFPHDGTLSPLAFRILKQGWKLPLAGMLPEEMMVVGEGGDGYFLYAGEARVDAGRVLMTFGLDLLSGTPEDTCLLDGMIRYALSDAFNPKGVVKLMTGSNNGWQETVKAGDSGYDNLPVGVNQIDVARPMAGKNRAGTLGFRGKHDPDAPVGEWYRLSFSGSLQSESGLNWSHSFLRRKMT
jgi:hypothetical protein